MEAAPSGAPIHCANSTPVVFQSVLLPPAPCLLRADCGSRKLRMVLKFATTRAANCLRILRCAHASTSESLSAGAVLNFHGMACYLPPLRMMPPAPSGELLGRSMDLRLSPTSRTLQCILKLFMPWTSPPVLGSSPWVTMEESPRFGILPPASA